MINIIRDAHKGTLSLFAGFMNPSEANELLSLLKNTPWSNHKIFIFGKWVKEPRQVAFFADKDVEYSYSKNTLTRHAWSRELLFIKDKIESLTGFKFNSLLVNHYRDGEDYMGWHSDSEIELGSNPIIISLSLGQERDFILRRKSNKNEKIKLSLSNGDLLVMGEKIQELWEHSLPKRKRATGERINLTFRLIK